MKGPLLILFTLLSFWLSSQSNIGIGEWKAHHTYSHARFVTQSPEKLYYGTELSIFSIDKEDNSVEFISKVEGLTETGIQHIDYDPFNDQLVIAYENSIVDLASAEEVFPIFNIKDNTSFVNKKINDTYVQSAKWLYFATGFGLVQFDMIEREFGFTLDANQAIKKVDGNEEVMKLLMF